MTQTIEVAVARAAMLLLAIAAAAPAPPIGKPGCETSCGNVSVPYPFGLGPARCYMPGFNLTCDERNRLLLGDDRALQVQVVEIFLEDATVRTTRDMHPVNMSSSPVVSPLAWGLQDDGPPPYPYAEPADSFAEFILTGCNVQATVLGDGDGDWDVDNVTSCASLCPSDVAAIGAADSSWSSDIGRRCPGPLRSYGSSNLRLQRLDGNNASSLVAQQQEMPVYAFVAEGGWFTQDVALNLTTIPYPHVVAVPLTLYWAVKHSTAAAAGGSGTVQVHACPGEAARSICRSSNSECTDAGDDNYNPPEVADELGGRYLCRCKDGYHGNPYLEDGAGGCQDIDECALPDELKPCYGRCTNTPGSFRCSCPWGTLGDPFIPGGCVSSGAMYRT